jgi:hypothetical protein
MVNILWWKGEQDASENGIKHDVKIKRYSQRSLRIFRRKGMSPGTGIFPGKNPVFPPDNLQ